MVHQSPPLTHTEEREREDDSKSDANTSPQFILLKCQILGGVQTVFLLFTALILADSLLMAGHSNLAV